MNAMPETISTLPVWAAYLIPVLAILGAGVTLLGSMGLVSFKNFYERVHAPTLGSTLGMTLIVVASVFFYSLLEGRLTLKPMLIGMFLTVTTPVTLVILARAAIYRDRVEDNDVPGDDY